MNRKLWGEIYTEHYKVIVKNIRSRADGNQDLAEDVVQSVFTRLMERYPDDVNTIEQIGGLLQRSAINLFVDGYRQRVSTLDARGNSQEFEEFNIPSNQNVEEEVIKIIRDETLYKAIDKLSSEYKQVLHLLSKGNTYEQIASQLSLDIGTVKSRISRGKEKLKNDKNLYA